MCIQTQMLYFPCKINFAAIKPFLLDIYRAKSIYTWKTRCPKVVTWSRAYVYMGCFTTVFMGESDPNT